jgi:hypothetical protein
MENPEWKEFSKEKPSLGSIILIANDRGARTQRYTHNFAEVLKLEMLYWKPITHWKYIDLPKPNS